MDTLEPKLIGQIVSHLALADVINCQAVCQHWSSAIASHLRVTRLRVETSFDANFKWFHTEQPSIERESVHPDLFLAELDNEILAGLQYLSIGERPANFELSKLSQFNELIQLELLDCLRTYERLTLQLPDLQVLYLGYNAKEATITIESSSLQVLAYGEAVDKDLLQVSEPLTVKRIHSNLNGERLARFRNVERISTTDCLPLIESTLTDLEQLKEIRVDEFINYLIYGPEQANLKEQLENFMNRKKELERDLKVVFAGVRLDDQTDYAFESPEHFYVANYERLDERLPFVPNVNYSTLLHLFKKQLPEDYHSKFHGLTGVKTDGPIDTEHFLWFLKSLHLPVRELYMCNSGCDQSLYEQLATFDQVEVFNLTEGKEPELSFNFITKWPLLVVLQIDQDLSPRSLRSLLDALRALCPPVGREARFAFTYDQTPFEVKTKLATSSYSLTKRFESKNFYELETLLAWLEPQKQKNGFWRRLLRKLKKGKRN